MPVIGSYVVFDPTGRDLADCYEVGRVVAVSWEKDDDGTWNGKPRPILSVLVNGSSERYAVTTVAAVLEEN